MTTAASLQYTPRSSIGLVMLFHDRPLAECGVQEVAEAAEATKIVLRAAGLYSPDVDIVAPRVVMVRVVVMAVFPFVHDSYEVIDSAMTCKAKG